MYLSVNELYSLILSLNTLYMTEMKVTGMTGYSEKIWIILMLIFI